MDARVKAAAQGALRRLGTGSLGAAVERASGGALRLDRLTLAQLSNLAYLQADDPLVGQVCEALKRSRPVYLDRVAVENALGLGAYPPRIQEQFARWFSRISGYGVQLTGPPAPLEPAARAAAPAEPPAAPARPADPVLAQSARTPEREILAEILGQTCPGEGPCVLEPGKPCCGSGRCRSLGF